MPGQTSIKSPVTGPEFTYSVRNPRFTGILGLTWAFLKHQVIDLTTFRPLQLNLLFLKLKQVEK